MVRIESLLSARLFVAPQLVDDRLYFVSNLSGLLSLYVMDHGGSVPEPLLPPHIALQNPKLIEGYSFYVFAGLGKILVMLDHDGDENYRPMLIPLDGGFPEPAFADPFDNQQVYCLRCYPERGLIYLLAASKTEPTFIAYRGNLQTGELREIGRRVWVGAVVAANRDHTVGLMVDQYTMGDVVLYRWDAVSGERELIYGTPIEARTPGEAVPPSGIGDGDFTPDDRGIICTTTLWDDAGGLGYLDLQQPGQLHPVTIEGTRHSGAGELTHLKPLADDRYLIEYNIDGCSWLYEGRLDVAARRLEILHTICGAGELSGGVLQSSSYDKHSDRFALSFATASSPTQIYTVAGADRATVVRHTRERILGVPGGSLAPGEDASFTSFDGLRISARLYLPSAALGFAGPRPLVYYIHGGPQSQERPDFAWFSMPLIQFLTLKGFAVFVPNVRGSTGYGLSFTKKVDRDWGGDDRRDHVHAMSLLAQDPRIDITRAGVMGRSYGGYMTLTLASRHPELWAAAIDMFGPYDLLAFLDRSPASSRAYWRAAVGDPETDRELLVERSPSTYIDQVACPLLVIQGQNDPRVIEQESRDVVERLRAAGKEVSYLLFDNEGHDVLKYENRVRCYNAITEFFAQHLQLTPVDA